MKKKLFLSLFTICGLLAGLLVFHAPAFAQDEEIPELTPTPIDGEAPETAPEDNQVSDTSNPPVEESTIDVFAIAQEVADTAEGIENGDPSGILGSAAHRAPAGTPFHYYLTDINHPVGCTALVPTLTCYWNNPIQQAIDDVAVGSTVTVDGGSYVAELDITKNITLLGINSPVISPPTTLGNDFDVSGNANCPIIHVTGASNVVIDGFTINGSGMGDANFRFIGIAYHNAGGTIQNNFLEAIRNGQIDGTVSGVGIYVRNDDATPRLVNILNNEVEDYQKGGIIASGQNLTVNIAGNTVTGQGPIVTLDQNGIQISGNAGGVVDDNTVTGNWYNGTFATSVGILVVNNSAPLTISNNYLEDNQVNIRIQDSYNVTVTGNTVLGGERGIEVASVVLFGEANATITGNSVSGNEWGIYTDNTHTVISNNSITGNATGLVFNNSNQWNINEMLFAPDNYWGCPTGPLSGDPACDTVEGLVMYLPFQPAPGRSFGNYIDGQAGGTSTGLEPEVLPVSSGEMVDLSCERSNILQLPDGSEVGFSSILCGYSAGVSSGSMTMTLNVNQGGVPVNILPNNATARISMPIPEGMQPPYAILFWDTTLNGGAGDWVVLSTERGYLDTDSGRMVTGGVTADNGMVSVEVNFTGTFVLVGQ